MEINLAELWGRMGFPVRMVVITLTLQAIACVAVIIDRLLILFQSAAKARAFASTVQSDMAAGNYDQVVASAAAFPGSHLAGYLELGLRTFLGRVRAGDDGLHAAELTRRALERKGDAVSRELNRGMNVLASTGSTAPFVGLLGTVLGIINAFKLIAANGSGGIGTIGAAIGEALVVTGYGLCVAIPSVLIFNWLSRRIADYESGLINAGSELVDQLECAAYDAPAQDPTAAQYAPQPTAAQYAPQAPLQHHAPQPPAAQYAPQPTAAQHAAHPQAHPTSGPTAHGPAAAGSGGSAPASSGPPSSLPLPPKPRSATARG
jgi:biopolymer transport protein ExbB/TolQ